MEAHGHDDKGFRALAHRMLGSIGVVYGDIGTSVLYALHESFFGHVGNFSLQRSEEEVLGVLSFFFWSLLLVVGCKYVLLIMRADNRGEGGIFALLALINSVRARLGPRKITLAWGLIIFGAALLLADGLITPAISVLSAVSGLEMLAPTLKHSVVPITVIILVALFAVQPFGTHRIGQVFGPIMLIWFACIALLGLPYIAQHPQVLKAVNPLHGFWFVQRHGWLTLMTLGTVVLCITGGEALYADMGHFGRRPIAWSWWFIVYPALLINYFGQGALLLTPGREVGDSIFYSLVPPVALIPMIMLATVATIIASQALISGSFSLIQQAIALGAFPRERIVHTNPEVEGQIYLPFVNWSLMVGCILLVIAFRTASALAAAYGIAVTGTMGITTIAFYLVARHVWHWKRAKALTLCAGFLAIDLTFFFANLLKFFHGGYVPIFAALSIFSIMHAWYWGRGFIARCYQTSHFSTVKNLIDAKLDPETTLLDRSLVVMSSRPVSALTDTIPPALQSRLDHLGAIYRHIAIISVIQHPGVREIEKANRLLVSVLQDDPERGSVTTIQVLYGYMQDPDLSVLLPELVESGGIRTMADPVENSFTILSGAERIITGEMPWYDRLRLKLFRVLLRNANSVLKYFNLENFPDISTEVVTLGKDQGGKSWLIPHKEPEGVVERLL